MYEVDKTNIRQRTFTLLQASSILCDYHLNRLKTHFVQPSKSRWMKETHENLKAYQMNQNNRQNMCQVWNDQLKQYFWYTLLIRDIENKPQVYCVSKVGPDTHLYIQQRHVASLGNPSLK